MGDYYDRLSACPVIGGDLSDDACQVVLQVNAFYGVMLPPCPPPPLPPSANFVYSLIIDQHPQLSIEELHDARAYIEDRVRIAHSMHALAVEVCKATGSPTLQLPPPSPGQELPLSAEEAQLQLPLEPPSQIPLKEIDRNKLPAVLSSIRTSTRLAMRKSAPQGELLFVLLGDTGSYDGWFDREIESRIVLLELGGPKTLDGFNYRRFYVTSDPFSAAAASQVSDFAIVGGPAVLVSKARQGATAIPTRGKAAAPIGAIATVGAGLFLLSRRKK